MSKPGSKETPSTLWHFVPLKGATLIQVIVDVGGKDRAALSLATVLTEHQWRTEPHSLAVSEEKHANPVRDIYSLCNIQLADLQQVS